MYIVYSARAEGVYLQQDDIKLMCIRASLQLESLSIVRRVLLNVSVNRLLHATRHAGRASNTFKASALVMPNR